MAEHTALYERCCSFVDEQSCGEWDDKTIREDATKLHAFIVRDPAVADLVAVVESALRILERDFPNGQLVIDARAALSRFRELEKGNG